MNAGYLEAKLEQLEQDVTATRADVKELSERVGRLEQPIRDMNTTFKVLQRLVLLSLALIAAIKSGTLDPLRALFGGH